MVHARALELEQINSNLIINMHYVTLIGFVELNVSHVSMLDMTLLFYVSSLRRT